MTPHRTTYRVIYADTDNMGIAYHANFFRWFEIGRGELFRALGMPYKEIESKGVALPLAEAHCKFLAPARYDDLVIIETSVVDATGARIRFEYTVLDETGETRLAEGHTLHACLNKKGRVTRPPEFLASLIKNLLAGKTIPDS